MIVYHGSYIPVTFPDVVHSRSRVDFGRGFYVTAIYEQAVKWREKFKSRGKVGTVSRYYFDETAYNMFKVLSFETYSEKWLEFIISCRSGNDVSNYDIVTGGVANDKVFNTVELYFDSLIDKSEAIKRLRYEKPNMQICFRNQKVIDNYLHFEGSETV